MARLAQSAECKALNLVVVGSSPTVGDVALWPSFLVVGIRHGTQARLILMWSRTSSFSFLTPLPCSDQKQAKSKTALGCPLRALSPPCAIGARFATTEAKRKIRARRRAQRYLKCTTNKQNTMLCRCVSQ